MRALHYLKLAVMAILAVVGGIFGMPIAFGATLDTESPVLTWRRVDALMQDATPGAAALFRSFCSFLMQQRAQVELQLISIADLTDDVNSIDGAVRVYAIYLKKQATATDAFFRLFDDATNSGTTTDLKVVLPLLEASKESLAFFPDGIPLAAGIVMTSQTTGDGTTDSTTGDGPNGFMLIGA